MTLTDYVKNNACCSSLLSIPEQSTSNVGSALREAVWQAQEQGRLRCGVVDCVHLLEIDPFNVLMCLIPATEPEDVSALIQRTLIKAFCHEYQILLVKVDSVNKFDKVLQGRPTTTSDQPTTATFPNTSTTTSASMSTLPLKPFSQTLQTPSSSSSSSTTTTTFSASTPGACPLALGTTVPNGYSPAAPHPGQFRGIPGSNTSAAATAASLTTAMVTTAMSTNVDTSCVLLKCAEGGEPTATEDLVAKLCKAMAGCDNSFDPTIALPD